MILPNKRLGKYVIIFLIIALFGARVIDRAFGKGKLMIRTTPAGASVVIDHKEYGKTPAEIKIQEGKHDLNINMIGYEPIEKIIKIKKRETTALDFVLMPIAKDENKTK